MRSFISGIVPRFRRRIHHCDRALSRTSQRARVKNAGRPADATGVDPISAPSLESSVAVAGRTKENQQALAQAMIRLIEICASVGRQQLPPDATFHTYA
jgi:hypothetical protein